MTGSPTFRALAVSLLLVAGCGAFTAPSSRSTLEPDTPYWFEYSAERRGAVLVRWRDGSMRFCAEPAPDVALRQAVDLVARAETPQGISAEAQAKFSADVIALAGRTQAILSGRPLSLDQLRQAA